MLLQQSVARQVKLLMAWGHYFHVPDEKCAHGKLPATQAQKLGYAYNW
jgi:hypothetical protein